MLWLALALLVGAIALQARRSDDDDRSAETRLVERLAAGDPDALGLLYDRHARPVFSLAFRILRDQADAEDVVQEVFAQAWRQAARFDAARGALVAWLLNMARSRAIDRLRSRHGGGREVASVQPALAREVADPGPAPDRVLTAALGAGKVRAALDGLPVLQRAALELAYYEGLSQSEIARRLDEPLGTVKTRMRLGLLKLREAMAGQG